MPRVVRSALLPYSALQIFELVNDIERYPEFLPWCSEARIVTVATPHRDAQLTISKGRVRECFTTRNVAVVPDSIRMQLVDGLLNAWTDFGHARSMVTAAKASLSARR